MAMNKLLVSAGAVIFGVLAPLLPLASGSQYILSVGAMTLLYAYLALSWNILGGIAGQLSLGHAAYFGLGAYT